MVVVATQLDASSERIINYLNEFAQLSINAMFFSAFEDNGNRYLSRAWMIDPDEPTKPVVRKANKEPWNFEFYVSFNEVGLFGNQNTVCKPTAPKWSHTISWLKQVWSLEI